MLGSESTAPFVPHNRCGHVLAACMCSSLDGVSASSAESHVKKSSAAQIYPLTVCSEARNSAQALVTRFLCQNVGRWQVLLHDKKGCAPIAAGMQVIMHHTNLTRNGLY